MNHEESYRILDVPPSASPAEIKLAYRRLAKVWHPDRFAEDPELRAMATAKLAAINQAYAYLKALKGASPSPAATTAKKASTPPPPPPRSANPPSSPRGTRIRVTPHTTHNSQAEVWFGYGLDCFQRGQYTAATQYLADAIACDRSYLAAYELRYEALMRLGFEYRAKQDFLKIQELRDRFQRYQQVVRDRWQPVTPQAPKTPQAPRRNVHPPKAPQPPHPPAPAPIPTAPPSAPTSSPSPSPPISAPKTIKSPPPPSPKAAPSTPAPTPTPIPSKPLPSTPAPIKPPPPPPPPPTQAPTPVPVNPPPPPPSPVAAPPPPIPSPIPATVKPPPPPPPPPLQTNPSPPSVTAPPPPTPTPRQQQWQVQYRQSVVATPIVSVHVLRQTGRLLMTTQGGLILLFEKGGKRECWRQNSGFSRGICSALSPSERILAIADPQTPSILLLDLKNGKPIRRLMGFGPGARSLLFDPFGETLIAGCEDRLIRCWEIRSGRLKYEVSGHGAVPESLALHQQDKQIWCAGAEASLRLRRLDDGKLVRSMRGHETNTAIALSGNGQRLAAAGQSKLSVLDLTQRNCLHTFPILGPAQQIKFAGTDHLIVLLRNGNLQMLNLPSKAVAQQVNGSYAAFTLAPGGRELVLVDRGGHVELWTPAAIAP